MPRFLLAFWCALLVGFTYLDAQNQPERTPRELPAPTDIGPNLTEQLRQLEQEFGDAILHRDANTLERVVGSEFTLRISDVPQSSLPRAMWMDNTLHRLKAESFAQRDDAARKPADDLAAVSLVWSGVPRRRLMAVTSAAISIWSTCGGKTEARGRSLPATPLRWANCLIEGRGNRRPPRISTPGLPSSSVISNEKSAKPACARMLRRWSILSPLNTHSVSGTTPSAASHGNNGWGHCGLVALMNIRSSLSTNIV
jgi:hypothetical protein